MKRKENRSGKIKIKRRKKRGGKRREREGRKWTKLNEWKA